MPPGRNSPSSRRDHGARRSHDPPRLSEFIRTRRPDILAAWEAAVRQLPVTRELDRPALIDDIPGLLDRIAEMADVLAAGGRPRLPVDLAEVHALERLDAGLDLEQVVAEYADLRDCIVRLWSAESPIHKADSIGIRALNQAIDRAVAAAVQRYTLARDRTLQSLDRISAAALETRSLDEFLERLLRVLLETTAAVDTAAILLRDGDVLRVRASAGLDREALAGWSVRVGEGFAGLIAETRRPHAVASATTDPLVLNPSVKAAGVKGLFGVPLIDGGEVFGVAQMGSLTAREFSRQDQRMFTAMAHRATSGITLHMLREAADRRARQQQAIAALGMRALAPGQLDALFVAVVQSVTETLSVELAAVLEIESDDALVVRVEAGWGPADVGAIRVSRSDGSEAGLALRTGQPVVVGDDGDERRFAVPDLFRERGIRSGITVPIRLPGEHERAYGVLAAHTVRPHAFSPDDVAFLQAAGHILGNAIAIRWSEADRALSLEQVNADIRRQRRAQAVLEEALAQQQLARMEAERNLAVLDTILSASSLGIGFLDNDLRYVRVNDALAAINDVPAEQHPGRTIREVLGEAAMSFLEPKLRQILETRQPIQNLEIDAAPPSTPDQLRSFLANFVPVVTGHGEMLGIGLVIVEVTERKRMELDLRERELRFRSIADNIPQLAWMTDEAGAIIWFNRRWYELTGTTPAQVEGWGWQSVHHPDHVARVLEKFRRHIASGEVWEDTFPLRGADGRYRWFLSRAVPIRDEHGQVVRWFGTNTDVSEQRLMHEAMILLSSSLEYRETLEHLARIAVPAFGDWCVIDVVEEAGIARVATAHTDPAKAELARELARRYPPDRSAPAGIPQVIRTGVTEHVPEVSDELLRARTRDPEHLRMARELGLGSYVTAPLVARGRTLGAITFVSAESGRRYTAADIGVIEELGRRAGLAIDNARLFAEAQREARMREEILAVVSHDLRNPLGAIHLAATMLLERPELRTRKHLETIHRAATRMDHLIGDLLDMASIQAGRLAIERRPEDAEAILREVVESHEPMTREKGLTLARSGELPGVDILVDRNRILQIFGNLIGNAIKFCAPGDTITIRGERRGAEVEIAVADTGPAISDAELPHIFEPYWSAKKYAKQGMGLGLYISKGIVEAHGGRLRVESQLGEGTTFFFTVPVA